MALVTSGCASRAAPPPSSSADLGAWLDANDDARPAARSNTIRSAALADAVPHVSPLDRWSARTISSGASEPVRPARRPPVDVSFNRSDIVSAFQLLADAGRFNVVMPEGLTGQVSATLRSIDPYDALKAMAEANGVDVRYDGQIVVLRKR